MKNETQNSMLYQGKVGNSEVVNEGNEGDTSQAIVHNTCTPTMGPTSEQLKSVKGRGSIKNHQFEGLTELEEMTILNKEWPMTIP